MQRYADDITRNKNQAASNTIVGKSTQRRFALQLNDNRAKLNITKKQNDITASNQINAAEPAVQMKGIYINDNRGLEKEADLMGTKALVTSPTREDTMSESIERPPAMKAQTSPVIQMVKIWTNGKHLELLYDAVVPDSYVLKYVPMMKDKVYIKKDDLQFSRSPNSYPYAYMNPSDAPPQIELFHTTAQKNLPSILQNGLEASRGGKGGFTDQAGEMNSERGIQTERQDASANLVHLGSRSVADTYYTGFKLLAEVTKVEKELYDIFLPVVRNENPTLREYQLKTEVKKRVAKDPKYMAAMAKLHEPRMVLSTLIPVADRASFDADPHELQSPSAGSVAVRTNRDIHPGYLRAITDRGTVPLKDLEVKQQLKKRVNHTFIQVPSSTNQESENALLDTFYAGVNKDAYNKEMRKKEDKTHPSGDSEAAARASDLNSVIVVPAGDIKSKYGITPHEASDIYDTEEKSFIGADGSRYKITNIEMEGEGSINLLRL